MPEPTKTKVDEEPLFDEPPKTKAGEAKRKRNVREILGISETIEAWLDVLPPDHELRRELAEASFLCRNPFVPKDIQNQPMACLFKLRKGKELGLAATDALQKLYMTPDGKIGMEAAAARSLLLKNGFRLTYGECTAKSAVVTVTRPGDDPQSFTSTWTIEDATAAGLAGKFNWKSYPAQMLRHRALMDAAREIASDVLGGIYSFEELADMPTDPTPEETHETNAEESAEIDPDLVPLNWQQAFKEQAHSHGIRMKAAIDKMRDVIEEANKREDDFCNDDGEPSLTAKKTWVKNELRKQVEKWQAAKAKKEAKPEAEPEPEAQPEPEPEPEEPRAPRAQTKGPQKVTKEDFARSPFLADEDDGPPADEKPEEPTETPKPAENQEDFWDSLGDD